MGWSSPSAGASGATTAGYRPYEDDSRGGLARGAAMAAGLAVAGTALGASPSRLAAAALIGVVLLGPGRAWSELRRIRTGLEAARTGPLPLLEGPRQDLAGPPDRSLRSAGLTVLAVLLLAVSVGELVFSFDDTVPILLGGMAGLAASDAIVLGWLRRRRARDRMQLYVRDVEGEEAPDPPRLHLVPRGH